MVTREFPPFVYGGGGVHVEFLVHALRVRGVEVDVHCLGAPRPGATAHPEDDPRLPDTNPALRILSADIPVAAALTGADLVHSHTWYTAMAGHWAAILHDVPHVITAHSLEPLRPWKADQLGRGYRLSCWAERIGLESARAVIAVSQAMRHDLLDCYPAIDPGAVHVIRNGVDTEFYRPDVPANLVERLGVALDRPYVAFVGRVSRQKGLPHLLRAARRLDSAVQLVILAGLAETPELAAETAAAITELRAERDGVFAVMGMRSRDEVRQLLAHALAFCCPSVYEPLGIVNLEATACGTAVVAGAVGGIPEVVADGVTGVLVPYDPTDPAADPGKAAAFGRAGRERAVREFTWDTVAERTAGLYRAVAAA
jgi:starch synthase